MSDKGEISLDYGTAIELLLVSNDWAQYAHQSTPQGGYLGRGLEKVAFKVSHLSTV